jgi:hypothetical protein
MFSIKEQIRILDGFVGHAMLALQMLSVLLFAARAASIPATVDLGYSRYQGTTLDVGVNQYLGIRYAAAPVGNLRFRAPADPEKTSGLQDATSVPYLVHRLQDITDMDYTVRSDMLERKPYRLCGPKPYRI